MNSIILKIPTMFGVGNLSRKAPGTLASLVTLAIAFLMEYLQIKISFIVYFGMFILSFISVKAYLKQFYPQEKPQNEGIHAGFDPSRALVLNEKKKLDPKEVVVDEFFGQLIAISIVSTAPLFVDMALAFILFRFFDIYKPFPINHIDEDSSGAFDIMFDDIIAGLFALLTKLAIVSISTKIGQEIINQGYCTIF